MYSVGRNEIILKFYGKWKEVRKGTQSV